jgi:hypothetical protein
MAMKGSLSGIFRCGVHRKSLQRFDQRPQAHSAAPKLASDQCRQVVAGLVGWRRRAGFPLEFS